MPPRLTIGVVLSGGASSRMGRPKALLRDQAGRTFLDGVVAALRRGGCQAVLVVGGRHAAELAPMLPPGCLLVHNPAWASGQLSSAKVGLEAALAFRPGTIVLHVVDQPLIRPHDIRRLLARRRSRGLAVAAHHGEPGHPIALSPRVATQVLRSRAATLRDALAASATSRVVVDGCSAGCVRGVNTPGELQALLGSSS